MPDDTILTGDAMQILAGLPDQSINLTVTSPPYDGIRDYHGRPAIDIPTLAAQLYRVTVDGGMACVVIQDQTKDFAESCTSFRLVLGFLDVGWRLFGTCIYRRWGRPGGWWNGCWRVDYEYILQFFEGNRPRHFDKQPLMIPTPCEGRVFHGSMRHADGRLVPTCSGQRVAARKCRGTVWDYRRLGGAEGNRLKR